MIPPGRIDMGGQGVIVTGAARGIGFGIAATLARWGAQVGIVDLEPDAVADACARIGAEGGRATGAAANVTDAAAIEAALDALRFGPDADPADLLVNNAGILSVCQVADMTAEEWRRVMEVNATGTFLASRAFVRRRRAAGRGGSIVSIASIAARRGDPGLAHYSASKFAVVGFTQALAREVAADDILVNAICPGVVETEMIATMAREAHEDPAVWIGAQAIGRAQTPRDIAFAAAFLHRSRAITGQTLNVDGGTLFD